VSAQWIDSALVCSPYCIALCKHELKRLKIAKGNRPDFLKTPHANATVHFLGLYAIVYMPKKQKGISKHQINSLLVHEAVHIWQAIRDPSSEFEAYAVQSISQNLMLAYWE
jgi:hypothetical protein